MVLELWFLIQMAVELGSILGPQNSISHFLIVRNYNCLVIYFPCNFWTTPLPKPVLRHCCPSNWGNRRIVPTELSYLETRGKILRLLIKNVFFYVMWHWPILCLCCPQTACNILRSPGSICYLIRQLHIGMTTGTETKIAIKETEMSLWNRFPLPFITISHTELVVQSAVTGLLEPCNSKQRKSCILINTVGICSIHSPEKPDISKYFSCYWMDDKIQFATAPEALRHPDWLLPDISYWDECFSSETELECFHYKGQFICFCKASRVVADLLGPSVSPASFVGKDLSWISSCRCSTTTLPGTFILVKNTWLIWIASPTFGNIYIFFPAWAKNIAKHLKQILWEC